MLDWENASSLNMAKIQNSRALQRFQEASKEREDKRKKVNMRASTFMTKSILVDTKRANATGSLNDRFLLENID